MKPPGDRESSLGFYWSNLVTHRVTRSGQNHVIKPTLAQSFLHPTSVALGAGEVGELRVHVDEVVAVGVELLELIAASLREDDVIRTAVTRRD